MPTPSANQSVYKTLSRAGHVIVTKSLGFFSEDTDDDYERITHHYKDLEAPKDRLG